MLEWIIAGYVVVSAGFFVVLSIFTAIGMAVSLSAPSGGDYFKLMLMCFVWPILIVWGFGNAIYQAIMHKKV